MCTECKLKTVDEISLQITPNLQKLLNDVLVDSHDSRPLMFGDELEFKKIKGKQFPNEVNACFNPFTNQFIIFLKSIDKIGSEEEYAIAHELGHLWLLLLGLPPEKKTADRNKQASWDTFFGPLREIMEHAVYYPLLKTEYQIDLYKIGNERLIDFIKNQWPNLKKETTQEKLLLMLNYLKYEVESDNHCWLEELHTGYSEEVLGVKNIADSLLNVIRNLAGVKDAQFFMSQYLEVLKILDTHFDIPKKLWPDFCNSN